MDWFKKTVNSVWGFRRKSLIRLDIQQALQNEYASRSFQHRMESISKRAWITATSLDAHFSFKKEVGRGIRNTHHLLFKKKKKEPESRLVVFFFFKLECVKKDPSLSLLIPA